jgi:hypothetical protein
MCVVMHEHQRPHHAAAKMFYILQFSEPYLTRNQLGLYHLVCRNPFIHILQGYKPIAKYAQLLVRMVSLKRNVTGY